MQGSCSNQVSDDGGFDLVNSGQMRDMFSLSARRNKNEQYFKDVNLKGAFEKKRKRGGSLFRALIPVYARCLTLLSTGQCCH